MASDKRWLAVEASFQSITLWMMDGADCIKTSRTEISSPASIEDVISLLDPALPNQCPVYAAGLTSHSVQLPAKVMDLPCEIVSQSGRQVHIVPNLFQENPAALLQADVTKVIGFLSLNPNWDGVICLPGASHSHWVLVSANEVISLQSAMTPTLARGLGAPVPQLRIPVDAVQDSLSKPELMAARFGELSARRHMGLNTWEDTTAQIWAHLIGAELAATRPYWLGQNLALIAPKELEPSYRTAFDAQYLPVTVADSIRMTQIGLKQACSR
ncbi:2-dehydro-3-deoxygalactonokinase [Epibacterium ulvae]|uniref:2-dehydro-3-deoxygalactonokinase n=1 Tax=Epibacterium ulvae TaxID=1156985 RepID=UPI0024913B2C|nr:2-dehydro-3-deoxygalactonokinase [Epibacterium ulvae]